MEQGIAPFAAGSENGLTVALDGTLTEALRDEGLGREIINKVQNLRKKSGFEVSDRIDLAVVGDDTIERVLQSHGERLAGETLAMLVADQGLEFRDEFTVDGHEVSIAIRRRTGQTGSES